LLGSVGVGWATAAEHARRIAAEAPRRSFLFARMEPTLRSFRNPMI